SYRSAHPESAEGLLTTISALGVDKVVLDYTLPEDLADALASLLGPSQRRLSLAAIEHRGRARLCAPDRHERAAAIERAEACLRRAAEAGATMCILGLGACTMPWNEDEVASLHARDEW